MANPATLRYTTTAQWLHWLVALLIISTWIIGYYLSDLPRGPEKSELIGLHKALGSTVLVGAAVRLIWRSFNPPPALADTIPVFMRILASRMFLVYYLLMILLPLSGWSESNAYGYPVKLAGVLPLPVLFEKNEALGAIFKTIHITLAWGFGILIVGHVGAALKHHFKDHDDTLLRMLPKGIGKIKYR